MISPLRILIPVLCAAVLMCHLYALKISGDVWRSDPIASLSRGDGALMQTVGLVLFAVALMLLPLQLYYATARRGTANTARRMTERSIQTLMVVSGLVLCLTAWLFTVSDEFDQLLLAVMASTVGIGMGLLVPYLKRTHHRASLFNAVIFVLWCLLIPVGLLVSDEYLGAYQRFTGLVLWYWVLQMALFLRASRAH